jgi:hypothetical protein
VPRSFLPLQPLPFLAQIAWTCSPLPSVPIAGDQSCSFASESAKKSPPLPLHSEPLLVCHSSSIGPMVHPLPPFPEQQDHPIALVDRRSTPPLRDAITPPVFDTPSLPRRYGEVPPRKLVRWGRRASWVAMPHTLPRLGPQQTAGGCTTAWPTGAVGQTST